MSLKNHTAQLFFKSKNLKVVISLSLYEANLFHGLFLVNLISADQVIIQCFYGLFL